MQCSQEQMRAYLIIFRAELPVPDIKVAHDLIIKHGFGDEAGSMLQPPLDADLHNIHK